MEASLPALRAFLAVAREQHFGHAADALHVSAPALSQLVKRLEANMGFALFERTTHVVALSPAGKELLPFAAKVVAAADELERWRRERRTRERSILSLAFTVNGAGPLMHRLLRATREEQPDVVLKPRQIDWRDLPDVITSGACDVGIARGPREFPGLVVTPILDEPWIVAVPSEHHFAARTSVTLQEVREEPIVRPDVGHLIGPRPIWLGGPHPDGFGPPMGGHAETLEEALDLVQLNDGLLITGESVGSLFPREGITYVRLTGLEPGQIVLLHRKDNHDPRVDAFLRIAIRVAVGLTQEEEPG